MYKLIEKVPFSSSMQIQKEKTLKENETNMLVFSGKHKNKNVEKIEQKQKDHILKVKINNFNFDMQIDSVSNAYTKKFPGTHQKANFTK